MMKDIVPYGVLMGLMLTAFILGWFGFRITMIILFAGYIFLWKSNLNVKARKEFVEKEQQLWDEHFRIYPNIESVQWINNVMVQVYKRHGEAIGDFVAKMVNPQIDRFRPPFLKAVQIDKITLGEVAPILHNFKVNVSNPDKIEMECYLNYPSDLNILISVRGGLGVVSIPIVIEKISVYAQLRIKMVHMDTLPFVKTVGISLLERPVIDFQLRPLKGIDLAIMIPGFTTWVNDLINFTVIEGMFLYPKEFELDIPSLMPPPARDETKDSDFFLK